MAKIEKETVITSYKGKLYSRLFGYMKPYLGRFIFAVSLVLLVTAFSLIKPILIAEAIDTYIEGYNRSYAVVDEANGQLQYHGQYLTKDYDNLNPDEFAQILLYEDEYYYFSNLDSRQLDTLYQMTTEQITDSQIQQNQLIVKSAQGETFKGELLNKDDLKVLRSADYQGIKTIAILYALVLLVDAIANIIQTWNLQYTGQSIILNIRNELFTHIHSLPLRFFDTHAAGAIDTRVTNDVEALDRMYSQVLVNMIRNTVMIIGYAVVMLTLNVRMALVGFITLPIVFALTYTFRTLSRRVYRVIRTKVTEINIFLSEHISGMKLIQIFAREKHKFEQFTNASEELYQSQKKELTIASIFRPLISFVANLALAIIVYRGSMYVLAGSLSIGVLYIFTSYIQSFFEPIQELAEQFSTLQNAFASAEKIFTLLDEQNPIKEPENPVQLSEVKGKIEFRHVWFAYDDQEYVLKDVSFVIQPGEKVAFVGATGAGKSSILNLIGRYYDIQKGEILIDDVNIKELSTKQIRAAIGQVQQDVHIFTGDVKMNIALLNEDISLDDIKKAAKAVNADHFIEQLPNKYDEMLSERGANLSAGQRQLLSFARTLAINPKILVMDEATANIDTETEQLIQQALKTMMEGRTTIMVAHRLSTIQHADNIIVMHHGRIREQGSHQSLLAQDGIYKKLYELQLYGGE